MTSRFSAHQFSAEKGIILNKNSVNLRQQNKQQTVVKLTVKAIAVNGGQVSSNSNISKTGQFNSNSNSSNFGEVRSNSNSSKQWLY